MAEYRIEPKGFYTFLAKKTDTERGKALLQMAIAMVEGKPSKLKWITKIGKTRKIVVPKEYTEDFLEFWKAYHRDRKGSKRKTFEAWIRKEAKIDECLKALKWQSKTDAWTVDRGKYFQLAETWINGCRWEDEDPNEGRETTGGYTDMNGIYHE